MKFKEDDDELRFEKIRKREPYQIIHSNYVHKKSCMNKHRYRDMKEAKAVIKNFEGLRAYPCPFCKGFHLTSVPYFSEFNQDLNLPT